MSCLWSGMSGWEDFQEFFLGCTEIHGFLWVMRQTDLSFRLAKLSGYAVSMETWTLAIRNIYCFSVGLNGYFSQIWKCIDYLLCLHQLPLPSLFRDSYYSLKIFSFFADLKFIQCPFHHDVSMTFSYLTRLYFPKCLLNILQFSIF